MFEKYGLASKLRIRLAGNFVIFTINLFGNLTIKKIYTKSCDISANRVYVNDKILPTSIKNELFLYFIDNNIDTKIS